MLALRHPVAPTVGTFHASAESSFGYRAATPWLERTIRRLTVRTVVSEAARVLISRYFPGDYLVTPNGVEVARFQVPGVLDVGAPPRVLFFGRIEPRKGLEVLIEAMTFLRDLAPTLVVVGSGPGSRAAAARARRLGIEARWLGRVSDADKARAFRSCEVYCAPGLGGESFGIVLLEAMAAGAPVVCSDLPAFSAVAGDAALLVPPDEPPLLAEALREVVTDAKVADGLRAAGRRIAARFDWSHLALEVERAYELALSRS
jgi:phosphatidylinositol alpha-mannosyltransferase